MKQTTIHHVVSWMIVALGLLHVLVTFCNYDTFSVDALWFAGTGVAIILAGFINFILLRATRLDRAVWIIGLATNMIFTMMFALASTALPQPQVFVGTALFVGATLCSFALRR